MINMTMKRTALGLVTTMAVVSVLTAACGDDDASTTVAPTATSAPEVVEVEAVDFGYVGLPERVAPGTSFTVTNSSDVELHELVAIRLPADETRSVEQLVADPVALAAYFPSVTTVVIAPPAAEGFVVEGTGQLVEAGRYAIICAIPTGADPEEYLAAAAETAGGPPQVDGGPPHFAVGMYAELVVEK